jgi:hypothetical protein
MKLYKKNKEQFRAYILLSIMIIFQVVFLNALNPLIFKRFFGDTSSVLVFTAVTILGFMLFLFLNRDNSFYIVNNSCKNRISYAFLAAFLFFIPIVIIDLKIPFPENINVSFPESIFFYPAMGFFVEIIFHLFPLLLLYNLIKILKIKASRDFIIWTCIIIVSIAEPLFQYRLSGESVSVFKDLYVFLHLYLINIASLVLFKKYDFISMYFFRFFYYILWHIIWGAIRIEIIF